MEKIVSSERLIFRIDILRYNCFRRFRFLSFSETGDERQTFVCTCAQFLPGLMRFGLSFKLLLWDNSLLFSRRTVWGFRWFFVVSPIDLHHDASQMLQGGYIIFSRNTRTCYASQPSNVILHDSSYPSTAPSSLIWRSQNLNLLRYHWPFSFVIVSERVNPPRNLDLFQNVLQTRSPSKRSHTENDEWMWLNISSVHSRWTENGAPGQEATYLLTSRGASLRSSKSASSYSCKALWFTTMVTLRPGKVDSIAIASIGRQAID